MKFLVRHFRIGDCESRAWGILVLAALWMMAGAPALAQTCPTEDPAINTAKSHKLYLYYPTVADASFPAYGPNVSPALPFDVTALNGAIGTTAQLIGAIQAVVVDAYCEFNVQVVSTQTNPATLASPPPRRVTVAIGSDVNGTTTGGQWGFSQEVDTGDSIDIDFARVWAGTYTVCEGGLGPAVPQPNGCSTTGALTGANATLPNWGEAIGGTAAHEAGHTYGLAHSDDDPQTDPCDPTESGPAPTPGDDAFNRHLMPSGCNVTGPDRTTFRRHFSDTDYGILATNVGLTVETMHNWDLVNPNMQAGSSLAMDFLSQQASMSLTWSYTGPQSPWGTPTVSGALGTAVFKGVVYNKFRITWAAANSAWSTPSPGVVGGGAVFHIGASFTGVDFNQPDPIIIQDVTLLDASGAPLALHPRLPSYDAGTLDATGGMFVLRLFPPRESPAMRLVSATVMQLPRMATIDSLVGAGAPYSRDRRPIRPWTTTKCEPGLLRDGLRCPIARIDQRPHVVVVHRVGQAGVVDCRRGVPRRTGPAPGGAAGDSTAGPDEEGPICAGAQRDPFPSAVVYVRATFVDPNVRHFDAEKKMYVTGPVTTTLFYQFAGIRRLRAGGRIPPGVYPK